MSQGVECYSCLPKTAWPPTSLSLVREILPVDRTKIQEVGGKETLVVRGEILPIVSLAKLYPPNLSISLSGGEETNKDALSNGE